MKKRILVAYDGSMRARSAVDWAVAMASGRAWHVVLLAVVEVRGAADVTMGGIEVDSGTTVEAERMLKEAATRFDGIGCTVETAVEIGGPVDKILERAKNGRFDLLVIGDKAKSSLAEFFLGSTAYAVSRKSPCTVMLVK